MCLTLFYRTLLSFWLPDRMPGQGLSRTQGQKGETAWSGWGGALHILRANLGTQNVAQKAFLLNETGGKRKWEMH